MTTTAAAKKTTKPLFTKVIEMVWVRETKGTNLYSQVDEKGNVIGDNRETVFGTVYLQKSSHPGLDAPSRLRVTVEAA